METLHLEHQSDDLRVDIQSSALKNVKVGLCIGGGIAAIETPKVIRELRRKGATVQVYATENALRFIGKEALEWSSSRAVTISPSGLAEHIASDDVVLVLPATADILGKAAHGICSDACTTYIQSAFGQRKPVYFVPTMHDSLRLSPAVLQNIETLSKFEKVEFFAPRTEEGKWKSPRPEDVALELAHRFNRQQLETKAGKKLRALVTLGGTSVPIDSARSITNLSSGTLGARIVKNLLESGVEIVALCGNHKAQLPECSGFSSVSSVNFDQFQQWIENDVNTANFDALFHVAAISDFKPSRTMLGKIESGSESLQIKFEQLPKLIKHKNFQRIPFKVACKYTAADSPEERTKAIKLLNDNSLNAVYWNWGVESFGPNNHSKGLLISRQGNEPRKIESKNEAAEALAAFFLGGK